MRKGPRILPNLGLRWNWGWSSINHLLYLTSRYKTLSPMWKNSWPLNNSRIKGTGPRHGWKSRYRLSQPSASAAPLHPQIQPTAESTVLQSLRLENIHVHVDLPGSNPCYSRVNNVSSSVSSAVFKPWMFCALGVRQCGPMSPHWTAWSEVRLTATNLPPGVTWKEHLSQCWSDNTLIWHLGKAGCSWDHLCITCFSQSQKFTAKKRELRSIETER